MSTFTLCRSIDRPSFSLDIHSRCKRWGWRNTCRRANPESHTGCCSNTQSANTISVSGHSKCRVSIDESHLNSSVSHSCVGDAEFLLKQGRAATWSHSQRWWCQLPTARWLFCPTPWDDESSATKSNQKGQWMLSLNQWCTWSPWNRISHMHSSEGQTDKTERKEMTSMLPPAWSMVLLIFDQASWVWVFM